MKLLIAGSRGFPRNGAFEKALEEIVDLYGWPEEVVSGNCKNSPDEWGETWATFREIPIKTFPADWDKHGKAAGPIRNKEMANYIDRALVYWDGQSRGSKNMIEELQRANKPYHVVYPYTK